MNGEEYTALKAEYLNLNTDLIEFRFIMLKLTH